MCGSHGTTLNCSFSEFMIQTRVKLFRRILGTAIQCDVLFTFPREVRYCKALSGRTTLRAEVPSILLDANEGTAIHSFPLRLYYWAIPRAHDHGSEANSESTRFPVIFSHHSPCKYNRNESLATTTTTTTKNKNFLSVSRNLAFLLTGDRISYLQYLHQLIRIGMPVSVSTC